MGNEFNAKMERRRVDSKGKNCLGYSECYFDKYEIGPIFFYELCIEGQNVCNVVSCMAECSYGSTYVGTRNVAMGMFVFSS